MKKKTFFLIIILPFVTLINPAESHADEHEAEVQGAAIPAPEAKKARVLVRERTQFFWQPMENYSSIVVSGEQSGAQYSSFTSSGTPVSSSAQNISDYFLSYSYGLTRNWAAEITVSSSPTQTQTILASGAETTTSTSGPNNVALQFKSTTPLGKWNLHYGLNLSLSLDINVPADTTETGDNFTGGDAVTPYIGTSYNIFGRSFYGFRLEYTYYEPRNQDTDRVLTSAKQKTGGDVTTFAAFFEWHLFSWLFDIKQNFFSYEAQQTSGTALTTSESASNAYISMSQGLGVQYFFTRRLMARLEGDMSEVPQITRMSTVQNPYNGFAGTLTLRDEF